MTGALLGYISDSSVEDFQPMGSNIGILPDIDERIRDKALRNQRYADRALEALAFVMEERVFPVLGRK